MHAARMLSVLPYRMDEAEGRRTTRGRTSTLCTIQMSRRNDIANKKHDRIRFEHGAGCRLIQEGFRQLAESRVDLVFVLGHLED